MGIGSGGELEVAAAVSLLEAIGTDSETADVRAPLRDCPVSLTPFAEKYPAHNFGLVTVIVAPTFEVWEKFLVAERAVGFAVDSRHDKHTVLRPLDRKALDTGDRIIIARRWWLGLTLRYFDGQAAHLRSAELPAIQVSDQSKRIY